VMSFESVGAILVVGLLVIPPATAYLLVNKLPSMLFVSCIIATIACFVGYYLSIIFDVSLSSMIIVTAGSLFMLVLGFIKIRFQVQKTVELK